MFSISPRGRSPRKPATPTPPLPPPPPWQTPARPLPPVAQEPVAPAYQAPARPAATVPAAVLRATPEQARTLILTGRCPQTLVVSGALNLSGEARLHELPWGLECTHLDVSHCPNLSVLPERLRAETVRATHTAVREVTGDWLVRGHLNLGHNAHLCQLPERLTARSLDVAHCPNLRALPDTLHLTGWLEVANSGLRALPSGLRVQLRWQGTSVTEQVALRPEELRGTDILRIRNITQRRVLLERFGLERFIEEVGGLVLDRDQDAGGARQLISIPLENDEPVVVVRVTCPSTGHQYVLRVPPHMRTCRQAAAWMAGFDREQDYRPLIET